MTDAGPTRCVATYEFDGRAWIVQFPDLGIATFGRTLAAARRYARSALAVHLELAADAVPDVVDDIRLPADVGDEVRRLAEQRSIAERMRSEVAEATRAAVADLRRLGLSTRDVGDLLGISGARVAQLEREADRE